MNFFIYRPDRVIDKRINPDGLYTLKGQSYYDWQRDKEEVYQYKVEIIKERLARPPKHKIKEWW